MAYKILAYIFILVVVLLMLILGYAAYSIGLNMRKTNYLTCVNKAQYAGMQFESAISFCKD